jgi:UDP-2-acetamido-2-deoxy-ribo-hexuluronate aminotransferase
VLSERREPLREELRARGVETLIHYPVPIPRQPALAGERPAACPVADRVCSQVLSLPLHQGMTRETVRTIAAALTGRG